MVTYYFTTEDTENTEKNLKIKSSVNSHRGVGPPYGPEAVLSVV